MTTLTLDIPAQVAAAARTLGETLRDAPAAQAYRTAEKRFMEDAEASALYQGLVKMQSEVHARRHAGGTGGADMQELEALYARFEANAVIQELGAAQQGVQVFLQEINSEVSALLGIDYASLARRCGSGCCG